MPGQLHVEGARELRKALKSVEGGLADLKQVHMAAGVPVATTARTLSPKRTGRLAGSVRNKATRTRGTISAGRVSIPYAAVIHFGWPRHNISPNPFLYAAIEVAWPQVMRIEEQGIQRIISAHGLDVS